MDDAGLTTTPRRSTVGNLARYWLPPVAWMGMIYYLSAQSNLPGPPDPWLNTLLKKGAHFGAYAGLAFWWWRALCSARETSPSRLSKGTVLALAFILTVLYATSDEFHQSFTPDRHPCRWVVLIDAAGAATALGLLWRRSK
jgi:VanZ family protein